MYPNVIECSKWFFQVCALSRLLSPFIIVIEVIKQVVSKWL